MDVREKLAILADAAKYDASCASSGSKGTRAGSKIGSTEGMGICHSYTPDGRCVSLLKILLTNYCIYDCQYCVNRISSDTPRARFTVDEVVSLTMEFYKRNYVEGLFLSSGIIQTSDYTMEQLIAVAKKLRTDHHYGGYIHLKTIPNASQSLIEEAGAWADRLSVNIELPTDADLHQLAPEKKKPQIVAAMSGIREKIDETKQEHDGRFQTAAFHARRPEHANDRWRDADSRPGGSKNRIRTLHRATVAHGSIIPPTVLFLTPMLGCQDNRRR